MKLESIFENAQPVYAILKLCSNLHSSVHVVFPPFINYINSRVPCACVSVCLSVISEISGTGGRSATLLAPTWRASPGELQQLLLDSKRRMAREKKPLELFRR